MKRTHLIVTVAVVVALLITAVPAGAGNGNNAPSGPHYNLNIIGVDNPKNAPMDETSRHTIFVPLKGNCNIGLTEGPYSVLDGNCFDSDDNGTVPGTKLGAAFQLPDPDPGLDGTLDYTVWVRAVTPKGSATMTTCFYDAATAETYCNAGILSLNLSKATYPKFANVSRALLTVCDPGTGKSVPLFSDSTDQYWWEYNNAGLKLAQLRFYPGVPDTAPYNTACTYTVR